MIIKSKQAMKKLVWSETRIEGGRPFSGVLPKPPTTAGPFQDVPKAKLIMAPPGARPIPAFYADSAVIAYRVPKGDGVLPPATVTASSGRIAAARLSDGRFADGVSLVPSGKERSAWIQFSYPTPQTVRALTLGAPAAPVFSYRARPRMRLEASDDGQSFRSVADFRSSSSGRTTVAFTPVRARIFRLSFRAAPPRNGSTLVLNAVPGADMGILSALSKKSGSRPYVVTELALHADARVNRVEQKAGFALANNYYAISGPSTPAQDAVRFKDVIDLTGKMRLDGSLSWMPPAGRWVVLRMGYSLTGAENHPATAKGVGLEVDKLNSGYVKTYMDAYLAKYLDAAGAKRIGRRGVRALVTDSIEAGPQNWTDDILKQFKQRRGYDPRLWLPVLTGVVIGDGEASDKFLYDFRRTLADLIAEQHYAQVAASAHERGMIVYGEALESGRPTLGDDMAMRRYTDVPMAAMWTYRKGPNPNQIADILGAASVAHICGQNLVAAESLTCAFSPWAFSPRDLRPFIDLEFVLGVNRPVIHTSVHQPVEIKPGLSLLIFGQYFNRHETWAEKAGPWVSYLSRTAYLLQLGCFAADVAYFYGEEGPLTALYGGGPGTDWPDGYGFDFVNTDVVLNRLAVDRGFLATRSGMRYRLLYLGGSSRKMTLPVLRRLKYLVEAGAVVVGSRPEGSPSLADDPAAFKGLADSLWGSGEKGERRVGKGKVIWGVRAEPVLAGLGLEPDFAYTRPHPNTRLMALHRRLPDGDLYFVTNRRNRPEKLDATFRVTGKAAELWHADTGCIEATSYRISGGRTIVPLVLGANESVFVVFRRPAVQATCKIIAPVRKPLTGVDHGWDLSLQPDSGTPVRIEDVRLGSWSESPDAGVKYFSGTGTYTNTLLVPAIWFGKGDRLWLDLGEVCELAEIRVNGKDLGIVWHPPFRVEVTDVLKPGANTLEVKVTNLWVNRLIGDRQPDATRTTFTTAPTYRPEAPLRPSGLIGPVKILRETQE